MAAATNIEEYLKLVPVPRQSAPRDFILNYDIKYRLGQDGAEEEEE